MEACTIPVQFHDGRVTYMDAADIYRNRGHYILRFNKRKNLCRAIVKRRLSTVI